MATVASSGSPTPPPTGTSTAPSSALDRWERNTRWIIVLAALIPLAGAIGGDTGHGGQLFIDLAAWLVFVVDLAVHLWWRRGYLRTWRGVIDLAIVVVTFPWYVVPGLAPANLLVTARLARVARIVVIVFRGGIAKVLLRLGKTAVAAVALVLVSAITVHRVEPASSGFTTLGDSIWWAIVTITTVGYGDLVPVTVQGRVAASLLMIGGLAVLGSVAATLGAYLQDEDLDRREGTDTQPEIDLESVLAEIRHVSRRLDSVVAPDDRDDDTSDPTSES